MASANYYEQLRLDAIFVRNVAREDFHLSEPQALPIRQDQREWVHVQRDCDVFGGLTDALYGPDTRSSAEGNHKWMPRSQYLGTHCAVNPPLSLYALSPLPARSWAPPEEIAADQFQQTSGLPGGHVCSLQQYLEQSVGSNPREHGQLQPAFQAPSTTTRASTSAILAYGSPQGRSAFQTPTSTPQSSDESSQFQPLLQTPTPAPRVDGGRTRSSTRFNSVQAHASPVPATATLASAPASSITSLDPPDPDPPPMGMLRPHEMNRNRYSWITPQVRTNIHAEVNAIWLAARSVAVTHDTMNELTQRLRNISDQVHNNERKQRIQFLWLPRILQWLQARQHFPQGTEQHLRATANLKVIQGLLRPEEAAYVEQNLQARTRAVVQGLQQA